MTRLYVHEVVTRDGFQIEPRFIPTEEKIAVIDALSETGLHKIEVTSFVSPKAVPALADAEAVMAGIRAQPEGKVRRAGREPARRRARDSPRRSTRS